MAGVEAQAQVCLQEEIASAAERGRMERFVRRVRA